ncbi:12292_t:CDS:2, partial [Racocetra fulgida]
CQKNTPITRRAEGIFQEPESERETSRKDVNRERQRDASEPGEPKKYSKNPEPKRESSRNSITKEIFQEPEPKRKSSREDVRILQETELGREYQERKKASPNEDLLETLKKYFKTEIAVEILQKA